MARTAPRRSGPAQRRLLALLAVRAGRVVTADQISEVLGLGSAGAVRSTVSRLRRVVGDVVTGVPPGYVLDADCVDVRRFEDLMRRASQSEPGDRIDLLEEAIGMWRCKSSASTLPVSSSAVACRPIHSPGTSPGARARYCV